jgi:PKD repeat protein
MFQEELIDRNTTCTSQDVRAREVELLAEKGSHLASETKRIFISTDTATVTAAPTIAEITTSSVTKTTSFLGDGKQFSNSRDVIEEFTCLPEITLGQRKTIFPPEVNNMKKHLMPFILFLVVTLFALPAAATIVSDFSYTVSSSDPLTIHFTEKSTGGAGNWFWTFDDGGIISDERNPTFIFSSEGTYMISCVAQALDYSEEDTVRKQLIITRDGVADDSSHLSSRESSLNGCSSENFDDIICFSCVPSGAINIPNPLKLISEFVKLIRIMVVPSNYNFQVLYLYHCI